MKGRGTGSPTQTNGAIGLVCSINTAAGLESSNLSSKYKETVDNLLNAKNKESVRSLLEDINKNVDNESLPSDYRLILATVAPAIHF